VSQAAAVGHALEIEPAESPLTPESWGKLGMWIFLAGDAMSFGGLLAGYAALRFGDPHWPTPSTVLGVPLTALMTFILICSSVTMVKGLSAIRHGDRAGLRQFLLLTALGGAVFLSLQAYEWTHLIEHGLSPRVAMEGLHGLVPPNFGATFFVLTGFHGCHVFSGVVYLLCVTATAGRYSAEHHNPVEIAGLYWHFVDLVWILIFTFVYLI
jgi:heme/copper-type cytochrome/quinol oxidase subunit 3